MRLTSPLGVQVNVSDEKGQRLLRVAGWSRVEAPAIPAPVVVLDDGAMADPVQDPVKRRPGRPKKNAKYKVRGRSWL